MSRFLNFHHFLEGEAIRSGWVLGNHLNKRECEKRNNSFFVQIIKPINKIRFKPNKFYKPLIVEYPSKSNILGFLAVEIFQFFDNNMWHNLKQISLLLLDEGGQSVPFLSQLSLFGGEVSKRREREV